MGVSFLLQRRFVGLGQRWTEYWTVFLTMDDDDYGDLVVTWSEAEKTRASDHDGRGFETESLRSRRLTKWDLLDGTSEPPTDNYFSGQHESPDHTLVYNAVSKSCRDLTACGSWDEIHFSTPNRKSKSTLHGMHLKNLSAASINQSVTEYAPSCISLKVNEQVPECDPGLGIHPADTSFPDIPILPPTIESSSEIYPPDALSTTPDQHLPAGWPSTYTLLATLGEGVHGKVFTARPKDNPDNTIYAIKTISKASLMQRGVTEVSKELWILRFITDASLSNESFPFLQKLQETLQDEKNLFIVLEYFPTTLANTETATPFRLSQKNTPGLLLPSSSKTYESEQEAIHALRLLAAELTLGLLFLHRHGIVHQDIKPANVMISEGGHAVIGEFSAASALPVPGRPDGDHLNRQCPSSGDEGGMTYGSIVLQPEDTVTFTPLYAAPELMERKKDGLLIYDERVDWWSLGVSLYEITTGGIPFHVSSDAISIGKGRRDETDLLFDLLEGLDLMGSAAHGCNAHLDGYLRSLLVHDPNHRLSGERAKSHPFLEPLQDIWTEIEDLRHPPCPKPSARTLHGDTDISFDLQEDSSKFDAECTQTSCSLPQTPHQEYYTPHEVFSSPEQSFSESSPFLIRRREALAAKRPEGQVLWNDNSAMDSNGLQESGSSIILRQEAFMSYYIETSFQTNGSLSGNPHPSTGSTGRFVSDEQSYGTCTIQRRSSFPEEKVHRDIVRAETSFTDSGLDFPLGSSPESWGHRKTDSFRKPVALELGPICEQRFQGLAKAGGRRIRDEMLANVKAADFPKSDLDWTFDEKITISLLQASLRERERSEPTVRSRQSKPQVVAAASERIIKAAGRRVIVALTRGQRQ